MFMYYYAAAVAIVSGFFDDTIAAVIIYLKHAIFYRTMGYKIVTKEIFTILIRI
jgi:hypothetical protein